MTCGLINILSFFWISIRQMIMTTPLAAVWLARKTSKHHIFYPHSVCYCSCSVNYSSRRRYIHHRVLRRGGEWERVPSSDGGGIRPRATSLLPEPGQRDCDWRLSHGQHQPLRQPLLPTQLWDAEMVSWCLASDVNQPSTSNCCAILASIKCSSSPVFKADGSLLLVTV